jgi:outer membrane receptor protein involved in Fe transport
VLVNGRRYINTLSDGGVDLATIPPELVERVEVVTGGASATYGSDAVGGVVNFIMRDRFDGITVSAQSGRTDRGENTNQRFSITGGMRFGDDRGSAYYHASYDETFGVYANGRSFVDPTLVNDGRGGFIPLLNDRVADGSALVTVGTSSVRARFDSRGELFSTPGVANVLPGSAFYNQAPFARLQVPSERVTIAGGLKYEVSDWLEFYSEGIFVKDDLELRFAPVGDPLGGYRINLANPFIGPITRASLASRADTQGYITIPGLTRRFEELGQRVSRTDRSSYRIVVGGKLDLPSNWTLDANVVHAESPFTLRARNLVNISRLEQGLDVVVGANGQAQCRVPTGGCVPVNIFGAGKISPAAANFIRGAGDLTGNTVERTYQAIITGSLFELPAGEVGVSGGVEYRTLEATEIPDDALFLGTNSFGAFGVLDGRVETSEIFGEASIPILKDMPLVHALNLEAGIRFTSLSPGSNTQTYKALLDWAVTPQVKVRGGFQRALRAPNIFELAAFDDYQDDVLSRDPCFTGAPLAGALRAACLATGVPVSVANTGASGSNFIFRAPFIGNPNLKPEDSTSFTVGVVFRDIILPDLSVTADFYDIRIDEAIEEVGLDAVLSDCFGGTSTTVSGSCRLFSRDTATGQVTRIASSLDNLGKLSVRGLDFGVVYRMAVPGLYAEEGSLRVNVSASYNLSAKSTPIASDPGSGISCSGYYGPNCGSPRPKWRANTRVDWRNGPLDLGLTWSWVGGSTDDAKKYAPATYASLVRKSLPTVHYFDLTATYDLPNGVNIRGGVENLFDKTPPIPGRDRALASTEISSFPGLYDHIGRRFFLGASVTFK